MRTMLIMAGAALVASPAIGADPVEEAIEEAAAAAAEATADERGYNRYVCKKIEVTTGTRMTQRRQICKTQAEWDMMQNDIVTAMQENARQALQD